jgi:hypothetical protein
MQQSHFAIIFWAVLSLTVFCGLGATGVAIFGRDPLTSVQQQLFNSLLVLFVAGASAVFGLIGTRKQR